MLSVFQALDHFLVEYHKFWCFEPFHQSRFLVQPWQHSSPDLCDWLNSLSRQEIEHYKNDTQVLSDSVEPFFPKLARIRKQMNLTREPAPAQPFPKGLDSGIPGRKLEQINAMGSFALKHHQGKQWLEWCSGKGYLGRVLAYHSRQKVTSFEWQQSLCEAGQLDADAHSLSMHFVQGDAFSAEAKRVLQPDQHAVALHACGDLHATLLRHAVDHQLPAVTISPCCYHLIEDERYQPLSKAAKKSVLRLTKADLRIPLQETVTGGERVKRHRYQEMVYRLGLDLLLRNEDRNAEYVPIPSIRKSELAAGFKSFCLWAADRKGLDLPSCDFDFWEKEGEKRFWQMERLSLVQQLFRRPLEIWLTLDRALFLEENGYRVSVSEFCSRQVTPRNVLIHAERLETRD